MLTSLQQHILAVTISNKPNTTIFVNHKPPHSKNQTKYEYTPLAQHINVFFQQLTKGNMVQSPITQPYDENQPKPAWYNDNKYCEYHCIGHDTKKCVKLKNYIQGCCHKQFAPLLNIKMFNNLVKHRNNLLLSLFHHLKRKREEGMLKGKQKVIHRD